METKFIYKVFSALRLLLIEEGKDLLIGNSSANKFQFTHCGKIKRKCGNYVSELKEFNYKLKALNLDD